MPAKLGNTPRWAVRIAELRRKLGMDQKQFSSALGTGQSNISRWESGKNRPTPDLFAKMARIAPDLDKFYFLEEAGLPKEFFMGGIETKMPSAMVAAAEAVVDEAMGLKSEIESQMVPILSDAVAAGNPLTINEKDIEVVVPFSTHFLPRSSTIYGLHVEGDSMSPALHDGDIVLVDVSQRDVKKLIWAMVAVRIGDGVTIKYLRKSGRFYQLVPENTSPRHEIRIMTEEDDWAVVGKVVRVIATPPTPTPPKKR